MIVPEHCLPLLRKQRTHYRDPAREYGEELRHTFATFSHLLPAKARRVLDIGCGMAGIDALLSEHYGHDVDLYLADRQGESPKIRLGFSRAASHYHDFVSALDLLSANAVRIDQVHPINVDQDKFPSEPFDVVISLLSWGFHYPIDDYAPRIASGGVIIADIRMGTNGEDLLRDLGVVRRVFTQGKLKAGESARNLEQTWTAAESPYTRVVVQC